MQKIQQKQVYELIRQEAFDDAKFQKKWLVIVDGTQTYSGSRKLNGGCLERRFHKDTEEETINYHCDVLEAQIALGENLIVSILSDQSLEKMLYLASENVTKKWTPRYRGWD